jgi:hypothetical protein
MSRDGTPLLAFALALILLLTPGSSSARKLIPMQAPEAVPIQVSANAYDYFPLSADEPLAFEVEGPVVFEAILRWRFVDSRAPVDVEAEFVLDGSAPRHHIFRARPGESSYPNIPGASAGRPERFTLGLRSGRHVIEVRLVAPREGALDVNAISREPAVLPWRIDWRGELGATYDSNIFRYSDADVDDFLDGKRPDRFPSETLDDLRIEPGVELALVREEPGVRSTELRLGADARLTAVNTEKSFARLSASVRETRTGVLFVEAAYAAIPSYHLRELWDEDAAEYRPCDFRKHGVRLSAGSDRSLPVDVAGYVRYEDYGYGPGFVEYDAEAVTVAVRGTVRPASGLRLDAGYALRRLEARGYDEIGESRETSDDSDTTYDQDEYELRARWEAGEWWGRPAVVSLRGKLKRRFYLTEKSGEDDPYHAGREDTYWIVGGRVALGLGADRSVEVFVEQRGRTAQSEVVQDIGERKDYTALRVGVRLIWEGVRFLD